MSLRYPSILPSVKKINVNWLAATAVPAILFTPLLDWWLRPLHYDVEDLVEKSILAGDSGYLIWAAAILVFIRTAVMMPYFFGALVVGITFSLPKENNFIREMVIPAAIVAAVYFATNVNYGTSRDYLAPLCIFSLGLVFLPGLLRHNIFLTGLVLLQLFLAFFWLDLAPALSFWGFGRGDLPSAMRMAAAFLGGSQVLNLVAISLFFAFFISAAALAWLTVLDAGRIKAVREIERREMELERMRLHTAEARVEKEMLTLVHDLKTPLMTIFGLNSLVAMLADNVKVKEYTEHIATGVERMNEMISELLYDDVRKEVTVDQLIDYVRAHVTARLTTGGTLRFDITPGLPLLRINFIRVVRALINLLENAITAVNAKDNGTIEVRATGDGRNNVVLVVADNGVGINPEELERVWNYGFSTKANSSGLGLDFARRVVEKNGGRIELSSEPGRGTTVTVIFPGVVEYDQNINCG